MLETISWISLGVAFASSLVITADLLRHPQKMGIMNAVWPVTALYGGPVALWAYFRFGRPKAKVLQPPVSEEEHKKMMREAKEHPKPSQISIAATHCGAGCTLGDVVAEFLVFGLSIKFLGSELWASYGIDYVFAWTLGVVFQYFTIAPMRGLSLLPGVWAAIKADTLSITAWQVGMYAWMALTYFVLFPGPHLHANQPQYWFMMQIAMIVGFFTSYPMNWILVKTGLKEAMV